MILRTIGVAALTGKFFLAFCAPPGGPSPTTTTVATTTVPVTTTVPRTTHEPPTTTNVRPAVLAADAEEIGAKGDALQATATGTFSNGSSQNVTSKCLHRLSDSTSVLTFSSGGLTAQASGASTI